MTQEDPIRYSAETRIRSVLTGDILSVLQRQRDDVATTTGARVVRLVGMTPIGDPPFYDYIAHWRIEYGDEPQPILIPESG